MRYTNIMSKPEVWGFGPREASGVLIWVAAYLLVALGFALPARAQTGPAPYTAVSLYLPGALLAGTISPAPSGQSNFPAIRYSYDGNERLSTVETGYLSAWPGSGSPSGWGSTFVRRRMTTYSYDTNGRKVSEMVTGYLNGAATGTTNLTQFSYDDLDRLTCTAVRMNMSAAPASSACSQSTPQGSYGPDRITQNTYDALNRLTEVDKAVGTSSPVVYATYKYTGDSLPQYITDADSNKMQLAYDGFDRLSDWYFPSKTSAGTVDTTDYEAYGYDNNGNRTSLKKRDGEAITYQYDPLNRMSVKQVPNTAQNVTYGYDLRGLMTSAVFTSSGIGITNVYDGFGRMTSTTNTMGGVSRAVSQGFDNDGDRTSVTFPADSNYFDYDYDGTDRLSDVRENGGTTIVSESYDPLLLSGETRGAVTSSYGYDSAERPQSWADAFVASGPNVTTTLAYNPANQITTRTRDNDAYAYAAYANGNIAYSPNGLNQYASVAGTNFSYDPNGNLTFDGSTSYGYDVENRLVTVNTTVSLTYDPLGRLFQVTSTSGTRQFLYDGDQLVAEFNGATGAMQSRYVPGPAGDDSLIWYAGSTVSSTTRRSLQEDHQGSIQSVADASGKVLTINRYDEYGAPATDNLGTFQYTGQAWLPEIGLYYYKARMYNPRLGRFMQTDPIGYKDDLDLYAYVHDEPIDGTDPTGTDGGCIYTPDQCRSMALTGPEMKVMGYALGAASLIGPGEAVGAGDVIVASGRALANGAKQGGFWWAAMHIFSGQLTHAAEKLGVKGAELATKQEAVAAAQAGLEKVAEAGVEDVKLAGQAALKAGENILKSAAAALMGGDALKSTSAVPATAAPRSANQSNAGQQKPMGTVRICYGGTDDCRR